MCVLEICYYNGCRHTVKVQWVIASNNPICDKMKKHCPAFFEFKYDAFYFEKCRGCVAFEDMEQYIDYEGNQGKLPAKDEEQLGGLPREMVPNPIAWNPPLPQAMNFRPAPAMNPARRQLAMSQPNTIPNFIQYQRSIQQPGPMATNPNVRQGFLQQPNWLPVAQYQGLVNQQSPMPVNLAYRQGPVHQAGPPAGNQFRGGIGRTEQTPIGVLAWQRGGNRLVWNAPGAEGSQAGGENKRKWGPAEGEEEAAGNQPAKRAKKDEGSQ